MNVLGCNPIQSKEHHLQKCRNKTKKDKVAYGGKVETGFIAQEVKEILQ